jgi:MFS family permease
VTAACHPSPPAPPDLPRGDAAPVGTSSLQRRTLAVLMLTQMVGGIGVAIGITVGALLAADMGGTRVGGFGQSALVVGAALLAVPVTRLMQRRGRRAGLVLAYLTGALGAALVVLAAGRGSLVLLFTGLFLFGGGSAANLQARYSAVDLAPAARRGRQLSWVVWATTVGSVAGPNLAPAADRAAHRYGAALHSGPFAFSAVAFLLAGMIIYALLRPDPLLTARALGRARTAPAGGVGTAPAGAGMRAAFREVAASPAARLGISAVAVGHLVMVGVMAMTPIHINEDGHGDTLRIIGVVLSVHIAGMYALAPVAGALTDRLGRRPVILGGIALLLAACAVAGTAGHDTPRLTAGLLLLGMGWSGTMVAGSTLVSESVGVANRPSVQGLSDLVMGLSAALAGALSGVVVAWSSYATLAALAAVATVPLLALALRPLRGGLT